MGKYNKLAKNTTLFFIANFGSKLLSFFLVRFYTELLSTTEYGIIDLLNTTASLAFPIITLCITEAVLRFSIDDISNRKKILSNGLLVTIVGNILFVLMTPIFLQFDTFKENVELVFLLTFTNSLFAVITHFSRGIGKTKLFALSGFLHTFFQIGLNLIFLLMFSMGIKGYLLASVFSNVFVIIVVFVIGKLHQYITFKIDKSHLKIMITYSLPLIPNSIFWWIMQSSDRYIITLMLSNADNGLYAVANKIPTLITTISTIFFQAWQISSVEESMSKDKSDFYNKIFTGLSTVLILSASFIMVILQPLYKILTEETYYGGWTSTPFLLCAMVFSCYSSFLGTNYVAMKKTKGVFLTTVIGAIVNVILNIAFIPMFGIRGTALATMIAFIVTWISRSIGTRKFVKINYNIFLFWVPTILLILQSTLLTCSIDLISVQIIIFIAILLVYSKLIIQMIRYIFNYFKSKRKGDN